MRNFEHKPGPIDIRVLVILMVVSGIVAASWAFAQVRTAAQVPELPADYFAMLTSRAGASTDQRVANLQEHLRAAPRDWQAYSQLGMAYLQKTRETGDPTFYQKAEGVLQKALSLMPEDYIAISAMGELNLARHQFRTALEWGERARRINPDRTYAYGVMADAQVELGQYEAAVETLQTMVDLRPDPSSYARISYLRELHGDTAGAIEIMQEAVAGGSPNHENTAWMRTQLANLYFNSGNLDQAEVEYRRTLGGRPGYVYALAGLGRVRFAQGRPDEAIQLLTEASQVMPLPEFLITLGDIYLATGDSEAAQRQYDLVRVIQQLYRANGVDVDLELALFEADHGGDPATIVEQARQAYERRPGIHAADVLAWALYQAGDFSAAQTYAVQALRLGTEDALKLFHAGMIAYRLGDEAQARDYLERALTINPHFSILYTDEAHHMLKELVPSTEDRG
jgi:tetratricopeptide (TPR) repeat protein